MKELVIISGKGGTGKTSLVAAFAAQAEKAVLCDADVDAADLHLVITPENTVPHDFRSGKEATIDLAACTACGLCRDLCRFDAIDPEFRIDPIACEGCGVCYHACPESAVRFAEKSCGEWYVSDTRFGPMVHARLHIAEENSGKLVALIRKEAANLAETSGRDVLITDGPPGIGCPVIAAIGGASAVLIITEPTVSGKHDLERVAELARHFKIPAMICINKFDLNPEMTRTIEAGAAENALPVVGRIPFDPAFPQSLTRRQTILEYAPESEGARAVEKIREAAWKLL